MSPQDRSTMYSPVRETALVGASHAKSLPVRQTGGAADNGAAAIRMTEPAARDEPAPR
jgi:hypothetical protein